jgi:hypothetical protein
MGRSLDWGFKMLDLLPWLIPLALAVLARKAFGPSYWYPALLLGLVLILNLLGR